MGAAVVDVGSSNYGFPGYNARPLTKNLDLNTDVGINKVFRKSIKSFSRKSPKSCSTYPSHLQSTNRRAC